MNHQNKKCLIIGPSWVGDMIMAQSLFIQLKQDTPELIIDVLAPAWSEPLLALMPEVNQSIVMPVAHGELDLATRYQLGKSLRKACYHYAFILPNSFKSALIPVWANIPQRIGYRGEMRYGLINTLHILDKKNLSMTVQRFVALASAPNINKVLHYPQPELDLQSIDQQQVLRHFKCEGNWPVLALCPGAEYGAAKCWPATHYAALATMAIEAGWAVWLLGSEKDSIIANKIKVQVDHPHCVSLAGETSLAQVISLLSSANQVVSNDSGLMHIAAAVNTPVIAIYGSSDPSFTPPLNDYAQISCLHLACSPCFKRECPLTHLNCLTGITPQHIWSMVDQGVMDQ
ncbi:MAG: lipopolysaccharide heptosyltransferase II [Cocleimonas sp.]|nr:lipopolysaccharide heptosyltransferase II [Cocleimonas sp.]